MGRHARRGAAMGGRAMVVVLLTLLLGGTAAAIFMSVRSATKPKATTTPDTLRQGTKTSPVGDDSTPTARGTAAIEPSPQASTTPTPTPTPAIAQPLTPQQSKKFDEVMNAAISLQNDGKWEQAGALLEQAMPQFVDQQPIYTEYGRVLTALQQHEKAYAQYQKAIAIGPVDFDLQLAAGVSASAAGKVSQAIEHFGAAQVLEKGDARPPLYLGQLQAKRGQMEEAKKNLLLAANLKPDMAVAWGSLADIALRENAANIAIQHIEKARQLEPESAVWRLIHGRALKRLGKAQEALDLVVGLSSEQKMQPGVVQLMGECYGLLQKPAEMARECSTLADTFTTQGEIALEAARWWRKAGDDEKAKPYARRALYLNVAGAKELAEQLGVK